jgi:hypothetical protein
MADGTVVPAVDSGSNYKLAATAIKSYVLSGLVTATNFAATSNGLGTSFKVGDDAWIGDVNAANTFAVHGVEDASQGYIIFGNANNTAYIGRSGTGAITVTGAFAVTGTTTLATSLTGLLSASSGVVSTATAGTDYVSPSGLTTTLSSYVTTSALSGYNYITTSSLSVGTANAASGTGAISYSAGVFKYTPPDLSTYAPLAGPTFTGAVTGGASITVKDVRDTVYPISGSIGGGSTWSPNAANGDIQTATLASGVCTFTGFASAATGQSVTFILTQPSSGAAGTWATSGITILYAGGAKVLSTGNNAVDMIVLTYVGSSTYYASFITGFTA